MMPTFKVHNKLCHTQQHESLEAPLKETFIEVATSLILQVEQRWAGKGGIAEPQKFISL
jgi:hypothetical protein